jgi:AhpD family alkylhydroperoxidase
MEPRITNPALSLPGVMEALQVFGATTANSGISPATTNLIQIRVSQINGCAVCLDVHARAARKAGEGGRCLCRAPSASGRPLIRQRAYTISIAS